MKPFKYICSDCGKTHEAEHELAKDFHHGISIGKAIKIAAITQHKK